MSKDEAEKPANEAKPETRIEDMPADAKSILDEVMKKYGFGSPAQAPNQVNFHPATGKVSEEPPAKAGAADLRASDAIPQVAPPVPESDAKTR